jgi:hypothetical protein
VGSERETGATTSSEGSLVSGWTVGATGGGSDGLSALGGLGGGFVAGDQLIDGGRKVALHAAQSQCFPKPSTMARNPCKFIKIDFTTSGELVFT